MKGNCSVSNRRYVNTEMRLIVAAPPLYSDIESFGSMSAGADTHFMFVLISLCSGWVAFVSYNPLHTQKCTKIYRSYTLRKKSSHPQHPFSKSGRGTLPSTPTQRHLSLTVRMSWAEDIVCGSCRMSTVRIQSYYRFQHAICVHLHHVLCMRAAPVSRTEYVLVSMLFLFC